MSSDAHSDAGHDQDLVRRQSSRSLVEAVGEATQGKTAGNQRLANASRWMVVVDDCR